MHARRYLASGPLLGAVALGLIAIAPALAANISAPTVGWVELLRNPSRPRMGFARAQPILRDSPATERAPALRLAQGHSQALPRSEQDTAAAATADDAASRSVRVADLIGLPIVDQSGVALGHVSAVATAADGKFQLLMPLGGLFGFGARLVPIPFESVVMVGAKITVLELPADRFQKSPTWYGSNSEALATTRTVRIGVPKS
jgi:sporulation protein YlmC with PRC-barrel domain